MGVGIEDVVAVKALETGVVPPVPNFREVDPELGQLNLSKGGAYPVALRAAPGRRLRLADQHDRCCAGRPSADGRRRQRRRARLRATGSPTGRPGQPWLQRVSGQDDPQLEVVRRTLRVADGVPAQGRSRRRARSPRRSRCPSRSRPRAGRRGRPSRVVAAPSRSPPRRPRRGRERRRAKRRCWRSSPRRPAIRRTCSTWISTSRRTWGSTRSSRRRCSRRSVRRTGSSATTR